MEKTETTATNLAEHLLALETKIAAYQIVVEDAKIKTRAATEKNNASIRSFLEYTVGKVAELYKVTAPLEFRINDYSGFPLVLVKYVDGHGDDSKHEIEFKYDRWDSKNIVAAGWFSTSETPTLKNNLVDYLKLVAGLNEAILNGSGDFATLSELIRKNETLMDAYNSLCAQLKKLQEQKANTEKAIATLGETYDPVFVKGLTKAEVIRVANGLGLHRRNSAVGAIEALNNFINKLF